MRTSEQGPPLTPQQSQSKQPCQSGCVPLRLQIKSGDVWKRKQHRLIDSLRSGIFVCEDMMMVTTSTNFFLKDFGHRRGPSYRALHLLSDNELFGWIALYLLSVYCRKNVGFFFSSLSCGPMSYIFKSLKCLQVICLLHYRKMQSISNACNYLILPYKKVWYSRHSKIRKKNV